MAQYAFVPGAAAILADWGADVVKVEHPEHGDAIRGLNAFGIAPGAGGITYLHEILNRGKRSVGLDVGTPRGREALLELVRGADVFVTNFLPAARARLAIEVDDLRAVNSRLVYARGSAYGPVGAESGRGGFDGISFWHRVGIGEAVTPPGSDGVATLPGPAFGDSQAAVALALGVMTALFARERGDDPPVVDASLLATGAWTMQASFAGANVLGEAMMPRYAPGNIRHPLSHPYRTADDRWVVLAVLEGDRHWPTLCRVLGVAHLADDPRFDADAARIANAEACVAELAAAFATATAAEWQRRLGEVDLQWDLVRRVGDLNDDRQAWDNGYLRRIELEPGRTLTAVAAPVQFAETTPELRRAPELGADTELVLLELGMDWDQISELKAQRVIS